MKSPVGPIYSPNKLSFLIGFPRPRLEQIAEHADRFYRPFVREVPGKKPRKIDNPIPPLKDIQKAIYRSLLEGMRFPAFVKGGVPGCSSAQNAAVHVGSRCVVTIDVADCYPSITNEMIFWVWHEVLGHSPTVSRMLTRLTTLHGHLPQGAPTSLALANLVLLPAMNRANQRATKDGLKAGQYVDDIGLSGEFSDPAVLTETCKDFSRIGLRVGRRKVRVMRAGGPQIVTGHTVNTKVGVQKNKRSRIRAAVHSLRKQDARSPEFQSDCLTIMGRVRWLARYHPADAKELLKELSRIQQSSGG